MSLTDNLLINLDNITNNSCTDHTNITEMMDLNISSSSSSLLCNFLERRHDVINGLSGTVGVHLIYFIIFLVFLIMGPFIAFPLTLLHLIPIMKNVRYEERRREGREKEAIAKQIESSKVVTFN